MSNPKLEAVESQIIDLEEEIGGLYNEYESIAERINEKEYELSILQEKRDKLDPLVRR